MPTTNDRLLLIKNGRVLDPATKTDATNDVLLDGARITRIGANLSAPDAEVFDATDMIVAPGFIDLHCHLREPGQEMSETIETGTRSAARGGERQGAFGSISRRLSRYCRVRDGRFRFQISDAGFQIPDQSRTILCNLKSEIRHLKSANFFPGQATCALFFLLFART